ncbi:metal-dependent transcriptional regulator [Deferribacterales bacterium RsTz2092]|nr:hypothetical protein AGMMS49941_11150 [Deferribacterales bacterium]
MTESSVSINAISPSLEDYLEHIYMEQKSAGNVRVKDLSRTMNVRMPSVNNAIRLLKQRGLVKQEPYGNIEMTESGIQLAMHIFERHETLTSFFIKLGISEKIAEQDACSIEHTISEETFSKLADYYKNFMNGEQTSEK